MTTLIMMLLGIACMVCFFLEAAYEHIEYKTVGKHTFPGKQHKRNRNQYLLLVAVGLVIVMATLYEYSVIK